LEKHESRRAGTKKPRSPAMAQMQLRPSLLRAQCREACSTKEVSHGGSVRGRKVTCARPWPSNKVIYGAVREWNGNPNAPDRVEKAARPAYGGQCDLCVEDSIGRVGHVRAAPRKEAHILQPPWHKPAEKDPVAVSPNDKGRRKGRAEKTHDVLAQ